MIHLRNKYLFEEVCQSNVDIYNEHIRYIKREYKNMVDELRTSTNNTKQIRFIAHKLVSIISYMNTCDEINYILHLILSIEKTCENVEPYLPYLQMLFEFDKTKLF